MVDGGWWMDAYALPPVTNVVAICPFLLPTLILDPDG